MTAEPRPKVLVSWSSGKDSAWTLHTLRLQDTVDVVGLLTTINVQARRVSMHAVREELLDAQAAAAGLPLTKVLLPHPCSNERYEAAMSEVFADALGRGVTAVAYGDLFLEDVRSYRERQLQSTGLDPVFPLWGRDTARLARVMTSAGVRAFLTCIDPAQLDASFAGRVYNDDLLDQLPPEVDPCGEHGEFHTFVYGGSMLSESIPVEPGEAVERDGFVYVDVLLK